MIFKTKFILTVLLLTFLVPFFSYSQVYEEFDVDKEDAKDVTLGTDDRQFQLRAKRAGTKPAGRIYTITYSATDGSGNKATASATVTVPHDQGK